MSETDVGLSELPEGWAWTTLEDCTEILDSQRVPINAKERETRISGKSENELYPYYGATGQVGWIDDFLFDDELILLGEDGAPFLDFSKDKAYLIKGRSWVNNHAHVLRARTTITSNQLLCHYLNIFDYHEYVTGTTRLKLNQSLMRKIPVPLAPLPEQHRIVAKIKELFTRLDAGIDALHKVGAQLKRYRQSVLKAAFEGKLTETWRAEHQDGIEPASPVTSDLPDGWMWTTVGSIGKIASGQTPKGINDLGSEGDIPFYKISDMNKPGNEKFMRNSEITLDEDGIEKLGIHVRERGTVIFPKRGGAIATNKKRILTCPSAYDLNIMGVLPQNVSTDFFYQWLSSIDLARLSDGSNVPQLNHKDIHPLPFPLPARGEQQVIVSEIECRLSVADEVEKTVVAELKRAEQLRQSILKKAFSGELVPQDSNDEPASVLLERIRAEKS